MLNEHFVSAAVGRNVNGYIHADKWDCFVPDNKSVEVSVIFID